MQTQPENLIHRLSQSWKRVVHVTESWTLTAVDRTAIRFDVWLDRLRRVPDGD